MKAINDTSFWDQRRNKIFSRKGGWKIGKAVLNHGYSMMDDLVGNVSYMQVMMLNSLGKLPDRRLADWMEAFHICLSWPDPRIWCNHIGALGAEMKVSAVAATSSGNMAMESRAYGSHTLIDGVNFIQNALKEYKSGVSVEELVKAASQRVGATPVITGYARPIAKGDERVGAMEKVTEELGFEIGEHLALAYKVEEYLNDHFSESMNINGYVSAFLSDIGFTAEQVYISCSTLVASGVTACYLDANARTPGSFLPLKCDDINYEGKEHRSVPEQTA